MALDLALAFKTFGDKHNLKMGFGIGRYDVHVALVKYLQMRRDKGAGELRSDLIFNGFHKMAPDKTYFAGVIKIDQLRPKKLRQFNP